jgi:hypothetical protein
VWNRDSGAVKPRHKRATADKESQRWLDTTARVGEMLAAADSIAVISDRESDVYEHFISRLANTHLIVRACQNRSIETDGDATPAETAPALLFGFIDGRGEAGWYMTTVPAAPGREKRVAKLAVTAPRTGNWKTPWNPRINPFSKRFRQSSKARPNARRTRPKSLSRLRGLT